MCENKDYDQHFIMRMRIFIFMASQAIKSQSLELESAVDGRRCLRRTYWRIDLQFSVKYFIKKWKRISLVFLNF